MRNRNEGLDLLKLICAFLVVSAHAMLPKPYGRYIKVFARITVPIFFMITGYFSLARSSRAEDPSAEGALGGWPLRVGSKGILKILKLVLFSTAFYIVDGVCEHLADGTVAEYLSGVFSSTALWEMFAFNKPLAGYHLWYLYALLYAMIAIVIMDRLRLRKLLYILIPFLLVGDLVLGRYSIFFFGKHLPIIYTRNWLFYGLPNICLGMVMREYDIVERARKYRTIIAFVTVFLIAGIFVEYSSFLYVLTSKTRQNYVFLILSSVPVFILFAQTPSFHSPLAHRIADMGRELSTGIYIIHVFFIEHLPPLISRLGLSPIYKWTKPVIVFALSAAVTWLYRAAKKRLLDMRKPAGPIS